MKTHPPTCAFVCAATAALAMQTTIRAATVEHIGTGHNWNVDWQPLPGLNDGIDGSSPTLDFVGDNANPCAYWADTGDYLYVRFRVATATATASTFSGAHFVLIDVVGYNYPGTTGTNTNGSLPDFGFAWDSKSVDKNSHGLEMTVLSVKDNIWNGINMNDIDGVNSKKGLHDINGEYATGLYRTGDGFVRSVDSQPTVNLGTTTFIDFSVKWDYLTTHTPLTKEQTWRIGLASIANATDHNNLNYDIGGGATVNSQTTVGLTVVPETGSIALFALSGVVIASSRRRLSACICA